MNGRCTECGALEPYWNASEADPGLGELADEIGLLKATLECYSEEQARLRAALEPSSIRYAMEHAGITVTDTELDMICRKLGIAHQQQARPAGTPCQRTPCKYPNCQCA